MQLITSIELWYCKFVKINKIKGILNMMILLREQGSGDLADQMEYQLQRQVHISWLLAGVTFQLIKWSINYTDSYILVGCQRVLLFSWSYENSQTGKNLLVVSGCYFSADHMEYQLHRQVHISWLLAGVTFQLIKWSINYTDT